MLAGTVIKNRTVFILQQDFGILSAHPYRRRGSRSTHNDFQIIFGGKSYCFIQPGKIIASLFRFQLRPCKLRKVRKLKSQLVHLLEITFPLTFIPVFGIIVNSCQCQVLIVEPGRSLCFYGLHSPGKGQNTGTKDCQNFALHILCHYSYYAVLVIHKSSIPTSLRPPGECADGDNGLHRYHRQYVESGLALSLVRHISASSSHLQIFPVSMYALLWDG